MSSCPPTEFTASVSPYGCVNRKADKLARGPGRVESMRHSERFGRDANDAPGLSLLYLESERGVLVGRLGQDRSDATLRACFSDGPLIGLTTLILSFPPRFRQAFSFKDTPCRSRADLRQSLFRFRDPAEHQDRRKWVCPCVKGGGTRLVAGCPLGRVIPGGRCPDSGTRGRARQSRTPRYSLHWLSIDRQGRAAFLHKAESPGQQVASRSLTECLSV